MRLIAIISMPFALIWMLGFLSFPVILGWQITSYVQTGYFPNADVISLSNILNQFLPISNIASLFLGYLPLFMHDLHISLILMGFTGLMSAPGIFLANIAQSAHEHAISEIINSISEQK